MPDEYNVLEVEVFNQLGEVVGPVIDVVPLPSLLRPSMAAPIMSDDEEPIAGEEEHLGIPVVGVERPAVAEDDGRALLVAPLLVVELRSISEFDERHVGRGVSERAGALGGSV